MLFPGVSRAQIPFPPLSVTRIHLDFVQAIVQTQTAFTHETEIIGTLNGFKVFDQTYSAPFSDSVTQAGVANAKAAIATAVGGSVVINGPNLVSHTETQIGSNDVNSYQLGLMSVSSVTSTVTGPATIVTGDATLCDLSTGTHKPSCEPNPNPTTVFVPGGATATLTTTFRNIQVLVVTTTTNTVKIAEVYELTAFGLAATQTSLSSSQNPSIFGQAVTFAATVTGAGSATGTVTFKDGVATLGTAVLNGSGQASFTTTSLSIGTHSITAQYGGDSNHSGSTSAALTQAVNVPPDSLKLRALQTAVTNIESQSSGQAISGAIDAAIGDGFSAGGAPVTATDNGIHFNLTAEPQEQSSAGQGRAGDAVAALGYAARNPVKAPPPLAKDWLLWADLRGTGWSMNVQSGDIRGGQVNALLGLTYRLTPDFLFGAFGGYENFDYTSQLLDGRLKGDGLTVGGYLGWRLIPGLRFDAGLARSAVDYDGNAGTAAATFPAQRWLATAALVGTYKAMHGFEIEPSLRVYSLWEHDDAYIDSLGVTQADRKFSNGRASAGAKLAYPWMWSGATTLTPYVGLYADYYFNRDDAALPVAPLLLPAQLVQGWSARVTGGATVGMADGARLSLGGELGGLGSGQFSNWSVRGRASVPF